MPLTREAQMERTGRREKWFTCVTTIIPPLHSLTLHAPREDRGRKSCEKLTKALNSEQQRRIDGSFTVKSREDIASASNSEAKVGKGDLKTKGAERKVRSLSCRYLVPTVLLPGRKEGG
jgi:hypothetical protein